MSAVSDEEKAYILTHHYDGRDDVAKTKSSSSATSSVPWYRQAAFVGCAALLAGVVIGRGLSPDARSGSQIGGQGTTPCFCGGNETNALPAHLAAEERMEEVISEKPEVEHEQHKSAAREKFKEQLREEYREERRERHEQARVDGVERPLIQTCPRYRRHHPSDAVRRARRAASSAPS